MVDDDVMFKRRFLKLQTMLKDSPINESSSLGSHLEL